MAEIEFSALGRDPPDRVEDKAALERRITSWQRPRNDATTKADWRFTTEDARTKLRRLHPTMEG